MNKEIAKSLADKLNKIDELQHSVYEELKANLANMGEQTFIYEDGASIVPIYYVNINNFEEELYIDKITVNSKGDIRVHDTSSDKWYWLSYLDYREIKYLIQFIDWK